MSFHFSIREIGKMEFVYSDFFFMFSGLRGEEVGR